MAAEAKLAIVVGANIKDAEQKLGKLSGAFQSMGKVAAGLAIGAVAGVGALAAGIGKLALDASKVDQVRTSFEQLAQGAGKSAQTMLASLQEASRGLVSDLDLMQTANEAMLLIGADVADKLPMFFQIAQASARATGQDVGFLFDSLVKGIGRASPMILDNLGLTIDLSETYGTFAATLGKTAEELTKAEQQQALMNAVMESGQGFIERLGETQLSLADRTKQMAVQFENTKTTIGAAFIPVMAAVADVVLPAIQSALTGLIPHVQQFASWLGEKIPVAIGAAQGLLQRLQPTIQTIASFITGTTIPALQKIASVIKDFAEGLVELMGFIIGATDGLGEWGEALNKLGFPEDALWQFIDVLRNAVSWIKFFAENAISWIKFFAENARSWLEFFASNLATYKPYLDNAVSWIKFFAENAISWIKFFAENARSWLEFFASNLLTYKPYLDNLVSWIQFFAENAVSWVRYFIDNIGPMFETAKGHFSDLAGKVGELGSGVATWITGTVLPAFQGLVGNVDWPRITGAIGDLAGKVGEFGSGVATWITGTALPAFQGLVGNIDWEKIKGALGDLGTKVGEFGEKVKTWITDTAVPKFKELVADVDWEKIKGALGDLGTKVGEFGEKVKTWITDTAIPKFKEFLSDIDWDGMASNIGGVGDAIRTKFGEIDWEGVKSNIGGLVEKLAKFYGPTGDRLKEALGGLRDQFAELVPKLEALWKSLEPVVAVLAGLVAIVVKVAAEFAVAALGSVLTAIGGAADILRGAIDLLISIFKGLTASTPEERLEALKGIFESLGTIVEGLVTIVDTALGLIWDTITNTVNDLFGTNLPDWEKFKEEVGKVFSNLWTAISEKMDEIKTTIQEKVLGLPKIIREKAGEFLQAGKDLIQGVIDGITAKWGEIKAKIGELASHLPSWMRKIIGAESPAKAFIEIGLDMMRGLAQGLGEGEAEALKAVADVIQAIAGAFQAMAGVAPEVAGFPALEGFKAGLDRLIEDTKAILVAVREQLLDLWGWSGERKDTVWGHMVSWAEAVKGVMGALQEASGLLNDLVGHVSPARANLDAFLSDVKLLVQAMGQVATEFDVGLLAQTAAFAEAVGKVTGVLKTATGGLTALADYVGIGQWTFFGQYVIPQMEALAADLRVVVNLMGQVAAEFSGELLQKASAFAEAVGKVTGVFKTATEGLTALAGYAGIGQWTFFGQYVIPQAEALMRDVGVVVQLMSDLANRLFPQWDEAAKAQLEKVQAVAETIGKLFAPLNNALGFLKNLAVAVFPEIAGQYENIEAACRSAWDIMSRLTDELLPEWNEAAQDQLARIEEFGGTLSTVFAPLNAALGFLKQAAEATFPEVAIAYNQITTACQVAWAIMATLTEQFLPQWVEAAQGQLARIEEFSDVLSKVFAPLNAALGFLNQAAQAQFPEIAIAYNQITTACQVAWAIMSTLTEEFLPQWTEAAQGQLARIEEFSSTLQAVFTPLNAALGFLKNLAEAQFPAIGTGYEMIEQAILTVFPMMQRLADQLIPALDDAARASLERLEVFANSVKGMFDALSAVAGGIEKILGLEFETEAFTAKIDQLVQAILYVVEQLGALGGAAGEGAASLVAAVAQALDGLTAHIEAVNQLTLDKLVASLESGYIAVDAMLQNIRDALANAFEGLAEAWYEVGQGLMEGLINGMMSLYSRLMAVIRDIMAAVQAAMEAAAQISSPSGMTEKIGRQMAAGLTKGWEEALAGWQPQFAVAMRPAGTAMAISSSMAAPSRPTGGGYQVMTINVNIDRVYGTDREAARQWGRWIAAEVEKRGVS